MLLLVLALLGGSFGIAFRHWLLSDLPAVSSLSTRTVRPTTLFVDRNDKLLYESIDPAAGRQLDLTLEDVPRTCVEATVATEDSRFYHHAGFDPIAIARAAWQNTRAGGEIVSGGSTLTQQLVRILLFDENERYEQSYRRKLREAWLAWRLESIYTKDELLALYLNQSYYGNFAFGLEAAAQTFFAKPAAQLSRGECALLAGLVQYPSGYNPLLEPETAKARQITVLRLMQEAGYLSKQEEAIIAGEPLRYRSNLFDIEAPHFVMYVQDLLAREVGVERVREGGLRVVTSVDLDLQRSAESAVERRLDLLNCRTPGLCTPATNPNRRVDNAAAVVMDASSGEVLVMVGSPDYFDHSIQGNVNAALALRQPGSAIKPLTYAVALDPDWSARLGIEPLTPASILADLPSTFYVRDESGGNVPYSPVNYDRQFHGPVSVRTALANSYNIPAVKVLDRIGVESLRSAAMQSGIASLTGEYGLALTLGGGEVSLLDLVAAYGTFQDGTRLDPIAILDVQERGADGVWSSIRVGKKRVPELGATRVYREETAFLITDILSDNVARMPAFGEGSVLNLPFTAAAKTGTTTDWRDNWTIGYTTDRIAGVWVGNADNAPMLDVSGIDGAGPIWRDIMVLAHDAPPAEFPVPSGIVTAEVCAPSGMLPSAACPQRRREHFIAGTEPTNVDDQFALVAIDVRTGQPVSDDTPDLYRQRRTVWRLPPEYDEWLAAREQAPMWSLAVHGVELPVDTGADSQAPLADREGPAIALTSPASNTAYQIHPALPAANQRIRLRGKTVDGKVWNELRLVVDDRVVATRRSSANTEFWWPLEAGKHQIWVEGETESHAPTIRSDQAYVEVTQFNADRTKDVAVTQPE